MSATGNTLDDFAADTFSVFVFCDASGRQALLDRAQVPPAVTVQTLSGRLRWFARSGLIQPDDVRDMLA